jgi:hypothetical protein
MPLAAFPIVGILIGLFTLQKRLIHGSEAEQIDSAYLSIHFGSGAFSSFQLPPNQEKPPFQASGETGMELHEFIGGAGAVIEPSFASPKVSYLIIPTENSKRNLLHFRTRGSGEGKEVHNLISRSRRTVQEVSRP